MSTGDASTAVDTFESELIAGACFQAEDAGEYYDPSPFAHSMPGA